MGSHLRIRQGIQHKGKEQRKEEKKKGVEYSISFRGREVEFKATIILEETLSSILQGKDGPLRGDGIKDVVEKLKEYGKELEGRPEDYIHVVEVRGIGEETAVDTIRSAILGTLRDIINPYRWNYVTTHEGEHVYLHLPEGTEVEEAFYDEMVRVLAEVKGDGNCARRIVARLREGIEGRSSLRLEQFKHVDVATSNVVDEIKAKITEKLEEAGIKVEGKVDEIQMEVSMEEARKKVVVVERVDTSKVEWRERTLEMITSSLSMSMERKGQKVDVEQSLLEWSERLAQHITTGSSGAGEIEAFGRDIAEALAQMLLVEALAAEC